MDSLTHLFYGGVIAAAIAPKQHRRAALLAGMALNTLPDLDALPLMFSDNPVVRMTWHRSATHSWLVLPLIAWALWAWFRSRGGRVAAEPRRWWWAILVCLMAHPLLDSFTVYGTQLLWPLPIRPLMWSSLFIIDPLFTLPWLLAFVVAWFAHQKRFAQHALLAGIVLGTAYVGWSLFAKLQVERAADVALASIGLADAPRFSVPMPLTTWRWRVVAMTPTGYVEGLRSLSDAGPMRFTLHRSEVQALSAATDIPSVQRLAWFNHGFMRADVRDGQLQLADLRMGAEPDYAFRFAVAMRQPDGWRAIPPVDVEREKTREALHRLWQRWRNPQAAQAATQTSGVTPATSASK
ncbi:MAG: metal-dependent hydrolase [Thermomonas sp.]